MRNLLFAAIFCLAAALFAGPLADADLQAIQEHLVQRKGPNWTWVFYGDSITHGAAHTNGWRSFPEIFTERVRYELGRPYDVVVNTGISGQTSVELTNEADYEWRVRRFQPNAVLILIGCNDIVHQRAGTVDDFKARLEKLVELVRADGAIPVLQTYNTIQYIENPTNDYYRGYVKRFEEFPAYNGAIRAVAAEKDTLLVDHRKHWEKYTSDPDTLAFWLGEPIHPGGKGHQEMAKEIFKLFGAFDGNNNSMTLAAGGEPPAAVVEAAAKKAAADLASNPAAAALAAKLDAIDANAQWVISYSAENGIPEATAWKNEYPADKLAIQQMDGQAALVAQNVNGSALFIWQDKAALAALAGVVCLDAEVALLGTPNAANFYIGLSAGPDATPAQPIVTLATNALAGFCPTVPLKLTNGTFYRLTVLWDTASGSAIVRIGDTISFIPAAKCLTPGQNNYCYFGDGGQGVVGSYALRNIRFGTL